MAQSDVFAYVGCWAKTETPPEHAFGVYRFLPDSGRLEPCSWTSPGVTVGHAQVRDDVLFCVDERTTNAEHFGDRDFTGFEEYRLGGGGLVYAFRIDGETGALTEINHQQSFGSLPAGATTDASGRFLLATHHTVRVPVTQVTGDPVHGFQVVRTYDDATTVLFPVGEDGSIGEPCDVYVHRGDGGPLGRQTHPTPHSVTMAPSGAFFLVCDMGLDEITTIHLDPVTRRLSALEPHATTPGGMPRYCTFHPTRPWVYVNYETRAVVEAFAYDEAGRLSSIGVAPALGDSRDDPRTTKQSDLRIHPSGRYVYDLIRGIHGVSVFAVDDTDGTLQLIQTVVPGGKGPRGCAVSPDGRFLYVAMLDSNEVVTCAIGDDGTLTPTGDTVSHPGPGNVTFFPPGASH